MKNHSKKIINDADILKKISTIKQIFKRQDILTCLFFFSFQHPKNFQVSQPLQTINRKIQNLFLRNAWAVPGWIRYLKLQSTIVAYKIKLLCTNHSNSI